MKQAALLIVDMQNDFVLEGAPLRVAQARSVVPKIYEVLAEFRKKRLSVFHILRVHRRDGSDVEITRQELFRKHPFAVEGTHGAAVIEELTPHKRAPMQIQLFEPVNYEIAGRIRNLKLDELRPIEALQLLNELQQELKRS